MSKNVGKVKYQNNEDNEENSSEGNNSFQEQYRRNALKNEEDDYNEEEYEEQGIKINFAKIEERPPDEEESCIISAIPKDIKLYQNFILKLKKLLKYKNQLYCYFNHWKKKTSNVSVKKRKKKKGKIKNKRKKSDSIENNEESNINNNENKKVKKKNKNLNTKKIKIKLKSIIEHNGIEKKMKKKYFDRWRVIAKTMTIEEEKKINEQNSLKNNNNKLKDEKNDNNNYNNDNYNLEIKPKELKTKRNGYNNPDTNKEQSNMQRFERFGQSKNDIINDEENKVINGKNIPINNKKKNNNAINFDDRKENGMEKENEYIDDDLDEENDSFEKKKKGKNAKSLKKKVKKKKNKKIKLKNIIKKINDHKIKQYYFNKWFNICKSINQLGIIKYGDMKPGKDNNNGYANNNNVTKQKKFDIVPYNDSREDINDNQFNEDINFDYNNDGNNNYDTKKTSSVIECKPVTVQRKYTDDVEPEVKENVYRYVRLSNPVKELHDDDEKKGFEVRLAEEYFEFGTQITRYPSEITETITTTTRIIPDNKEKNVIEEEIVYQDGKIIHEKVVKNTKGNKPTENTKSTSVTNYNYNNGKHNTYTNNNKNLYKDYNMDKKKNDDFDENEDKDDNTKSNEIKNDKNIVKNNKNNNNYMRDRERKNNNIIIKENEVPRVVKMRTNQSQKELTYTNYSTKKMYNEPEKDDDEDDNNENDENEDNNNYFANNNSNKDILFKSNTFRRDQNKPEEDNYLYKSLNRNEINLNDNFLEKDIPKKDIYNTEKKQKRIFKRYKKAFHVLRRLLRNRKKRNKHHFDPDIKMKFYLDLWHSNTFPEGVDIFLKSKSAKIINKNKLNPYQKEKDKINDNDEDGRYNSKMKETLVKLVDIITNYIKRNKIIDLNEIDDLNILKFYFDFWRDKISFHNIENENENEKEEEEKNYKKENNFYIDSNKKNAIKAIINNYSINNNKNIKISDKNYNNNNKGKIKKNKFKLNKILIKLINRKDIQQKRIYFEKWLDSYPLERTNTLPYSKPIIHSHSNDIQSPISAENDKIINNSKLNKIKNELINNANKISRKLDFLDDYKNGNNEIKSKEIAIINTDLKDFDKNNDEDSFLKSEENLFKLNNRQEKMKRRFDIDTTEEENYSEINTLNRNKKYNKNIKGNKKKLLKIKNILNNLIEKINDKKIIYFFFNYWYNSISLKKNKKINNEMISPKKIMSNIKKQFSPSATTKKDPNTYSNNLARNYKKKKSDDDEHYKIIFTNARSNKKTIILRNDITNKRKRSNTFLKFQDGNYGIEVQDSNDEEEYYNNENEFNDSDINKNSSTVNIKPYKQKIYKDYKNYTPDEREVNNHNSVINLKKQYIKKKNNLIPRERSKRINQNIFDMSKRTVNVINKNADIFEKKKNIKLNNELKNNYVSLLKNYYNKMVCYQIFYLYSLYNERVDYFKLKYVFNRLKNQK